MNATLTWDSNASAYGAIHLRRNGKFSVGGVSFNGVRARGFIGPDLVYDGPSEDEAMSTVMRLAEEREKHQWPEEAFK